MPHTFTAGERAIVSGNLDQYAKLEIQDPDLAWVDVSTALSAPDWFNSAVVSDDIDANTMSFSAELLRDAGSLSLAPLLESSTINRNALSVYAPMLDLVRQWRFSVCAVAHGGTPIDYEEIAKGYIDTIDVNDKRATIQVAGRGQEAPILDTEILVKRTYSPASDQTMETVIQQLLNDNMDSPPTVYVPVAMSFIINSFEQGFGNLMGAVTAVSSLKGAVLRYRYDAAGVNRFTLFIPPREAAEGDEDWTIGSDEYLGLPLNRLDISGVRNFIPVQFYNVALGIVDKVQSPLTGTSGSITSFGRRSMPIDLGSDTQVTTAARAQALADAVRSDMEFPKLQQQFETFSFWFVQLTDWGKLLPNGVMY